MPGANATDPLIKAARGAATSAISQGIGVATGLQDKFNFAGVAAAGVAAGVGQALDNEVGGSISSALTNANVGGNTAATITTAITSSASAIANAATRSALDGTNFKDGIRAAIPDVIGQAVGGAIARSLSRPAGAQPEHSAEILSASSDALGRYNQENASDHARRLGTVFVTANAQLGNDILNEYSYALETAAGAWTAAATEDILYRQAVNADVSFAGHVGNLAARIGGIDRALADQHAAAVRSAQHQADLQASRAAIDYRRGADLRPDWSRI